MSDNHRRQWCAAVAKLVYPVDPARCVSALIGYLPLLRDMPDEAFNPHSAEAVALADRRMAFPSYDEVAKPLRAWWRDNRPAEKKFPALAHAREERRPRTPEEIAYAEARTAEALAICAANRRPESLKPIKAAYLTPEQLRENVRRTGAIMPPYLREDA